jgi:protoporphyrinogen IX oxidase
MLLVWALGLAIAHMGGWFSAPWLMFKLALVLFLSGLHGLLSGTLRRLDRTEASVVPSILSYAPAAIILCVLAIVIVVVIKPL